MRVPFESLPVPALLSRDEVIIAANAAYEAFMGVPATDVVGRTVADLVQQFVTPRDVPLLDGAAEDLREGRVEDGHIWCRVVDGVGRSRAIRVRWVPGDDDTNVVYLLDAEDDATAKSISATLARAAGELVHCRSERELLERAVDALYDRGFTSTVLLLRDGDPLLEYGPSRNSAQPATDPGTYSTAFEAVRPARAVLTQLNPHFDERRAAFFQDIHRLVGAAYPADVAARLRSSLPGRRVVQAPLFVDDVAYGALVVTSDALTPAIAGAIELFAELVARAIESVRLQQRAAARLEQLQRVQGELVERERLAALGEAAAVMAHEVRNPIAALLNAAALLQRAPAGDLRGLLAVVSEEATRLERLVTDLLELGRPLMPRLAPVDLAAAARASVRVLEARAACASVTIAVDARVPALALADPDLLQLALLNVVRNAAQASPGGAAVDIAIRSSGDEVSITVDDSGAGFTDEVRRRAFEPFFTTRATGTGIGLAVVRRVVEACAGRVEVGASPAGGGRVELVFPRAP
jgi:signal transduction histidine kinase